MAGIVLKITIMDTHPPVWRRVVVPEKMCFEDLHRVIQIFLDGRICICIFLKIREKVLKLYRQKKMPEYTADYATVLKVKGDNFVEDFCGDWDEDIQSEIYDIEKVNHTLQKMHFKETDMPDDYDQMMKSIALFKEGKRDFYKYFREQAEKFLKNLDDNEKNSLL